MKNLFILLLCLSSSFLFSQQADQAIQLNVNGLEQPVEILVDTWGIPHIYAKTEADLFFAQGYYAASDRLFQFEIWRRQSTGTVAEILGKKELKRDIGTRLFMFRGDMEAEMAHYHPNGKLIIESFVRGVNAYIDQILKTPENLPLEFQLLNIKPEKWTPEVVISRHQGLLGNIGSELSTARMVNLLGPEKVQEIHWFHPKKPLLSIDPKINAERLMDDILELYNAYRRPVRFQPEDLISQVRNEENQYRDMALQDEQDYFEMMHTELENIGSNNWIVSGDHTQSGYPIMANDPHRSLAVPSLRYMAHLVGPGWNVIGGGEPEIPGISIGHNEHGAWGLTVFRTDAEDLYVYETNPNNPDEYKYNGSWEQMKTIQESINIKDAPSEKVELKYTRHGPVVYADKEHNIAYAVRCGWLEVGGSPYLASLRMDQATDFESFREACNYSNIPGENMIWADRAGHIGWQSVGIAPVRKGWSGLVPVPGDGAYEWDKYLPIIEKPNLFDPPSGIFITANADVTPKDYTQWDAIGFSWSDPYREDRLWELLNNGRKHSLQDMCNYQTDYLSIPARSLAPLIYQLNSTDPYIQNAIDYFKMWDYKMTIESIPATIYIEWEKAIKKAFIEKLNLGEAEQYFSLQTKKMIDWLESPGTLFAPNPIKNRDDFLIAALQDAIQVIKKRLGPQMSEWQLGQLSNKHVLIKHPLTNAVNDSIRQLLDVGPAPRGGYALTVNNSSNSLNQRSGASFRIICDTEDWDRTLAMNSPGQAGNPHDPHYRNLFDLWVNDRFFPMYYSKAKIEKVTVEQIILSRGK
jgi:penicillin amidase